jgi:IMP cyclohydrolase
MGAGERLPPPILGEAWLEGAACLPANAMFVPTRPSICCQPTVTIGCVRPVTEHVLVARDAHRTPLFHRVHYGACTMFSVS